MENFLEVAAHGESILHREGWEGAECDETDTRGSRGCKTRRVCGKALWVWRNSTMAGWPGGFRFRLGPLSARGCQGLGSFGDREPTGPVTRTPL